MTHPAPSKRCRIPPVGEKDEGFRTELLGGVPVEVWEPAQDAGIPADSVVIVHGFWAWSYHLRVLARPIVQAGFRVYSLSLRGHHPEYPVPLIGKVPLASYFEDMERVAAEVPALKALIGHSLGGLIALKAAEAVQVPRLVLLSPSPPRGVPFPKSPDAAVGLLRHSREILFGLPMIPDFWIARRTFLRGLPPEKQKSLYRSMVHDSGTALRETAFTQMPVAFQDVKARTLVLIGDDDNVTPPPAARRTAEFLRAEFKSFPHTGHHLMETPAWPAIVTEILRFLA